MLAYITKVSAKNYTIKVSRQHAKAAVNCFLACEEIPPIRGIFCPKTIQPYSKSFADKKPKASFDVVLIEVLVLIQLDVPNR